MIRLVFATHSTSEDNETGNATGWLPGRLSAEGRRGAEALGARRRDEVDVVFCSDLARAVETVRIAFEGSDVPVLLDWRLRETDYGEMNGMPRREVHGAVASVDERYPGGESWTEAVDRCSAVLADLFPRWDGRRVLVIGHAATRLAVERWVTGAPLAELVARQDPWQPLGWDYELGATARRA